MTTNSVNISQVAHSYIITRYYSTNIEEDTSMNELYHILCNLSMEERYQLYGTMKIQQTEQNYNVAAKYIELLIEKFYNYIREIPHHANKTITSERKRQIFYDKIYWKDISNGLSESEARQKFENNI